MARLRGKRTQLDDGGAEPLRERQDPFQAAVPSREVARFTPRTGLAASVLGTGLVLAGAGAAPAILSTTATVPTALGAGSAALVAGLIGGKIRGRTLGQWISLRRNKSVLPEQAALFSRDGVGVVFDGHTVTALVQITPRPWQVTCVGPTGVSEAPVISADLLRQQLTRQASSVSFVLCLKTGSCKRGQAQCLPWSL